MLVLKVKDMDKAALYELEKKNKKSPKFGRYYYDWPSKSNEVDVSDDSCDFELERLQEIHVFNR